MVNDENMDEALREIARIGPGKASAILYGTYVTNLLKAVDLVYKDDHSLLADSLRANIKEFAAYKAYDATKKVQEEFGNDMEEAERVLHRYNRTQTAEYNTTISRCRTAKQFEKFKKNSDLFPNIQWLPSRSAEPREEHEDFYWKVWKKDDDFWKVNTPGSLWNCKCDWQETDLPVTNGNPRGDKSAEGLEGNPFETGKVFSPQHKYFDIADQEIAGKAIGGIIRKVCKISMNELRGSSINVNIPGTGTVNVICDKTTVTHLTNDAAKKRDFTIEYLAKNYKQHLKQSKFVAHKENDKPDTKMWTVQYFYAETTIPSGRKYYFNIEEVNIIEEKRHFYRLYAITNELHGQVIPF